MVVYILHIIFSLSLSSLISSLLGKIVMKKEKEDDGVDEMKGQNIRLFFSCFYLQKLKTV